eukprot:3839771-Amphidinium_carterae.1
MDNSPGRLTLAWEPGSVTQQRSGNAYASVHTTCVDYGFNRDISGVSIALDQPCESAVVGRASPVSPWPPDSWPGGGSKGNCQVRCRP